MIDNLKAAVKHPDWFDPELVPKVAAFAAHYGTVILPTKPYTPRHKGKVERGIDYVQENGLRGRTFASLTAENEHLLREVKPLDEFDFAFNPSIQKKQIFELATCRFIRESRDVLLLGAPGLGKSFLCQAIGLQAIKQGFVVLYRSIFDVVRDFLHDEALGEDDKLLARYLKPDLVIIDDMGMKQLPHCHVTLLIHRARSRFTTAIIRTTAKSWK